MKPHLKKVSLALEVLARYNSMMYKIETLQYVEGYRTEVYSVEADSEEEATNLVVNYEVEPLDGDIDIKNTDAIEITYIGKI